MAVSGVFGIGYQRLTPGLPGVGAIVAKTVTLEPRAGNPEKRIIETPSGMLNSIGLQNSGVKHFLECELPDLLELEMPIIVSIGGSTIREYEECSRQIAENEQVDAVELNVSCPNVDKGCVDFGSDEKALGALVRRVRRALRSKPLIVKLTPNVTDIVPPAVAAADEGADAIALINTLRGMAIDLVTYRPKLGNRTGGLSGQAIHPVAVYMVHRCYTLCCRTRHLPLIGMGGVATGDEALELILAGATCVGIGTAMFRDPSVFETVARHLERHLEERGYDSVASIVGKCR